MGVTSMFLGGFSSVLHQNGVPRKMLHNGHHHSPLRITNNDFRSFFDHFTVISRRKALETSIEANF